MTYFQTKTRETGESFVCLADDAPEWVADTVRDCHDGELPNDWRYETISAIFDAVADGSDDAGEIADSLTDVYTSARFDWLAEHIERAAYVDDSREELGEADGVADQIGYGQYLCISGMATQILAAVAENGNPWTEMVGDPEWTEAG